MISKIVIRIYIFLLLTIALPSLNGCIGGGGGGSNSAGGVGAAGAIVSNLGEIQDNGDSSEQNENATVNGGPGDNSNPGTTIAKIHNPEPTTMLLFGSGMMAYAFVNKRKKIK